MQEGLVTHLSTVSVFNTGGQRVEDSMADLRAPVIVVYSKLFYIGNGAA